MMQYHTYWKQVMLCVGLLIGGAVILAASTHTVTCANWDDRYFHRDASAQFVSHCLETGQAQVNQRDGERRALLHRAVMSIAEEDDDESGKAEQTAIIRVLLKQASVNVDAVDVSDRTPLHYALRKSDAWPVAAILLDAGADPAATPRSRRRIQEKWIPMLGIVQRLVSKGVTKLLPSELLECQEADCIVDLLLKDEE